MHSPGRDFSINQLSSGGVITNYYCSSRCAHCLYGCSPKWPRKYIDKKTLVENLKKIKSLNCQSIHVGGGEPFLDSKGLRTVLKTACEQGIRVEYVETNSSWFIDRETALRLLDSLKNEGLDTLLVSISPFHNEHISLKKVKGVIQACEACGMNVFPWIADFFGEIDSFDNNVPHRLSEYERKFGSDYLKRIPSRYWVHFGGRALSTFAGIIGTRPYSEILSANPDGCSELLDVSHFHFDLFGNYIPGLCSGIAIRRKDVGNMISERTYPLATTLFRQGINGLFDLTAETYGFRPLPAYLSKCHLCFDIRYYLVKTRNVDSFELQPREFYNNV